MSRFLKPEVVRIDLTGGDWITIKKQLTAGEQRRVFARTTKQIRVGEPIQIDLEKAGLCNLAEYLIDWSFTDQAGQPVPIRDMPAEYVEATLNSLDPDSFNEITRAIDDHEKALAEEKKLSATVTVS